MASERTIVFHGTSFSVGLIVAFVELGALPWWWLLLAAAAIPLNFFWQRWVAGRKTLAAAKEGE